MALQTSGTITLADIQTEFGGSNPIGINEYYAGGSYVPSGTTGTNGAIPSSGAISLYNFYGSSAEAYWFMDVTGRNTSWFQDGYTINVDVDASKNIHIIRSSKYDSGDNLIAGIICKYSGTGSELWSRSLYPATQSPYSVQNIFRIKVSKSSGNVYIVTNTYLAVSSPRDRFAFALIKYNSSGTIQWVKSLGYSSWNGSSNRGYVADFYLDSSENCYILTNSPDLHKGTTFYKYNSSGTLQWQRYIYNSSNSTSASVLGSNIVQDSSGNLYLSVTNSSQISSQQGYFNNLPTIMKYNSSGVLQWSRGFYSSTNNQSPMFIIRSLTSDSNSNIHTTGLFFDMTSTKYLGFSSKHNSSGVIQSFTIYDHNENTSSNQIFPYPFDIIVDSSNFLYISGCIYNIPTQTVNSYIMKLNNTHSITWKNTLSHSNTSIQSTFYNISTYNDKIYAPVYSTSNLGENPSVILKPKPDGSGISTYGSWTYSSDIKVTSSSGSFTDVSSPPITDTAGTFTDFGAGPIFYEEIQDRAGNYYGHTISKTVYNLV